MLDTQAIETLSVNAVRDSIVLSEYLAQCIHDNDREPSWDGHVYIYNDKSKNKSQLRGRIPVQVKGTENNELTREEITFSVSTIDLQNYLNDGGIIFFVVYIDSTGANKQIYYAELPPIKIRALLKAAQSKKTTSIKLKKFPDDPNRKAIVFYSCFENCQKQASFCNAELYSLEDLEKAGVLEGISIPVSTIAGIDPKTALFMNEVYLYANVKGSPILQPIDFMVTSMFTTEEKPAVVTAGQRIFYNKIKQVRDASTVTTIIGESFKIICTLEGRIKKWNYNETNNLRALVVDLDFILAFVENKCFSIDGAEITFRESDVDFSKFDIEAEKEKLKYYKRVAQTLDSLGCAKDLNIKQLSENDLHNIDYLIDAFVDEKSVSGLSANLPPIVNISVGGLNFLISPLHVDNEPNTYVLNDFFKKELCISYQNTLGETVQVPQYYLLHAEDLLKADNIKYDVFLPSFQKMQRGIEQITWANLFMLQLIMAFDLDNSKRGFIEAADSFADWLMEATEEELPYDVRLLNKLQILKRLDGLSTAHIKELYKIVETPNRREDVLVGAYLLLGQQTAAELHFDNLDQEEQEEFMKLPIYHFWKKNGGKDNGQA